MNLLMEELGTIQDELTLHDFIPLMQKWKRLQEP